MNFLDRVLKYSQISNSTKILRVGAELFYTDGRTETDRERQASGNDEANSSF